MIFGIFSYLSDFVLDPFEIQEPVRVGESASSSATLRHIRSKAIDIDRFVPEKELEKMPHEEHVKFEFDRIAECMAFLKGILNTAQEA